MKLNSNTMIPGLMALALLNAAVLFVHRVMTNGDNLDYLFIAGCVLRGDVLEPFRWRFPVGYSYLIAGFAHLSGFSIKTNPLTISTSAMYAIQCIGVLISPVALFAVWKWCRTVVEDYGVALAITALFATTQHVAPLYSIVGSEPCFILLSWLALWAWERSISCPENQRTMFLGTAALCSFVAILFRQIGLALPVAVLGGAIWMGMRRDGRRMAAPSVCALVVLVASIVIMLQSNPSHLNQISGGTEDEVAFSATVIGDKIALLAGNAHAYRMILPQLLFPKLIGYQGLLELLNLTVLELPLALLCYFLWLVGLVDILLRRKAGVISAIYTIVSSAIFLIWPYIDGRFFIPLIPAIWFITIAGFFRVMNGIRMREQLTRRVFAVAIAMLLIWQSAVNVHAGIKNMKAMYKFRGLPAWHPARYERSHELDFADHLDCGLWLSQHAEPKALVYGEKPAFLGLASGRETIYLRALTYMLQSDAWKEDHTFHYAVMDSFPVTVGYGKSKQELLSLMEEFDPPLYALVYEAPHGAKIYKRIRSTDSAKP